jgi:hypothetical protein
MIQGAQNSVWIEHEGANQGCGVLTDIFVRFLKFNLNLKLMSDENL